jgi:hypothetical protein
MKLYYDAANGSFYIDVDSLPSKVETIAAA